MNNLANIWNHPKTSVTGLLIAIVTVAGVLSQQGIHLGHAGSGTTVTLIGALATAILGLLARDPGQPRTPPSSPSIFPYGIDGTTSRLGVLSLIALLLPLPFIGGCSGPAIAQDIVNWTPTLQSAVATVDTTAALLAPADAPIFAAATAGFDAASTLLVAQARAYLANPTASLLQQMQTQVVTFQQQVNAGLLQVARITNPASQQHALSAIQAVATVVNAMLSLVQSISTRAAVTQMAANAIIKRASIAPLLDPAIEARLLAAHYREPAAAATVQVADAERALTQAGF